MSSFKVALIGNSQAGKSAWVMKCSNNEFVSEYNPTPEATTHLITFDTTQGPIELQVLDCPGSNDDFKEDDLLDSDAAIIFFDPTQEDVTCLGDWSALFKKGCPTKPIILIGNKVDLLLEMDGNMVDQVLNDMLKTGTEIKGGLDLPISYGLISTKTEQNLYDPFLHAMQMITENDRLDFVISEDQDES